MPELPEVETVARDLIHAGLVGRKISKSEVFWARTIATHTPKEFNYIVEGKTILSIGRRGKFLVLELSGGYTLFIHLRMSGRLTFDQEDHIRISLHFSDGAVLHFNDTRKFGKWYLVKESERVIGKLGPEPLDPHFTASDFAERLSDRKRQLKPLLLDQTFIAGLGNVYVDEALWHARLHPKMLANQLKPSQAKELLKAIRFVLRRGIKSQGTTLGKGKGNFYRLKGKGGKHQHVLDVYRRTGLPCHRCKCQIKRIVLGQRSTHFCPLCQG